MEASYALVSALPPELVAEILDVLQRGSPQDVLSYCASNGDARRFCHAPVIPWQRRYADLAPYLGDVGDLASVLDIARASIKAQQEVRRRAKQEAQQKALNAQRCAIDGLTAALHHQPDYQDVATDMPLEAYLDALPQSRFLAAAAQHGDLALFDTVDPDTVLYPDNADGLVLIDVAPHSREMTLLPLILSGMPLGADWFADTVAARQLAARVIARRRPQSLYEDLSSILQRGMATARDRRCLDVNYASAIGDILPNARLYYAEIRGTPQVGYRAWVLAPHGPLSVT